MEQKHGIKIGKYKEREKLFQEDLQADESLLCDFFSFACFC